MIQGKQIVRIIYPVNGFMFIIKVFNLLELVFKILWLC